MELKLPGNSVTSKHLRTNCLTCQKHFPTTFLTEREKHPSMKTALKKESYDKTFKQPQNTMLHFIKQKKWQFNPSWVCVVRKKRKKGTGASEDQKRKSILPSKTKQKGKDKKKKTTPH